MKYLYMLVLFLALLSSSDNSFGQELEINNVILQVYEQRIVPSSNSGVIKESKIVEGMILNSGDLIVQLEDEREKLDLARLRKELEMADAQTQSTVDVDFVKKSVKVAEADLKRAQKTNDEFKKLIPVAEIERLRLVVERNNAELEKSEFNLKLLGMQRNVKSIEVDISRFDLSTKRIVAPIKGRVEEIFRKEGEWVEKSEKIARITRLDILKAEVKLPAKVAVMTDTGKKVLFEPSVDFLKGNVFEGEITFVESEINPVDLTVRVWVKLNNEKLKLRPGMRGKLSVITGSDDS